MTCISVNQITLLHSSQIRTGGDTGDAGGVQSEELVMNGSHDGQTHPESSQQADSEHISTIHTEVSLVGDILTEKVCGVRSQTGRAPTTAAVPTSTPSSIRSCHLCSLAAR